MIPLPERNGASTNLSDLSSRLGLSVSTVSRALRNSEGVDAATRTKVLAEAARAGYRGMSRGAGRRAGGTRTILVLSRNEAGMVPYDVMAGMSRAAIELNISIVTHQTPPDAPEGILEPKQQPPALRTGQVDGIVLSQDWPEPVIEGLGRKCPLVSVLRSFAGIDHIGIDPVDGMDRLVGHLVAGDLGFFGGDVDSSFSRQLARAFHAACAGRGRKGSIAADCDDAEGLVRNGTRTWICADVPSAELLSEHLRSAGCPMTEEVEFSVFLSLGYSGRLPGWTMLTINPEDLGAAAVRCLLQRIEAPLECIRSILLQGSIHEGAIPPLRTVQTFPN